MHIEKEGSANIQLLPIDQLSSLLNINYSLTLLFIL